MASFNKRRGIFSLPEDWVRSGHPVADQLLSMCIVERATPKGDEVVYYARSWTFREVPDWEQAPTYIYFRNDDEGNHSFMEVR